MPEENSVRLHCPAKVNLLLAITGRRDDGYHELVSVVAPLAFGDTLHVTHCESPGADTLSCDVPGIPLDESNLVLAAASAFRQHHPVKGHFHFVLEKRIPHGAGLGGGSSNGAGAILALQELCGHPLNEATCYQLAAALGSDCPLFLKAMPLIMRGRGEQLEDLSPPALAALQGRRILLFKPPFAIGTAWAYGRMKAQGDAYVDADEVESRLAAWQQQPAWESFPLLNNMQSVAFEKYVALPVLLQQLREQFGLRCMMSGSGSACFADIEGLDSGRTAALVDTIRQAWGPEAFIEETQLAGA
ncbi:MAG: 4-(cytidine 5'-diphospho)-2-C-methyl-D-erythritol kinase [Verrucomicrobiota bacterium]